MESLEDSTWDDVIAGTGLQESLLALSLSRSSRRILHIDKHGYYGDSEAAFSLQEVESWVEVNKQSSAQSQFRGASIEKTDSPQDEAGDPQEKLSFPRAYSIALAPQIIYTSSALLPNLVASKVDQQLDFLAVGSWYVLEPPTSQLVPANAANETSSQGDKAQATLFRIPAHREDILNSTTLSRRSKQLLTKFLRFLAAYDTPEQYDTWSSYAEKPFFTFLTEHFDLPVEVQRPIQALVLSTLPSQQLTTRYALDRIARHVGSMGLFGEGFNAVIPKWGGLAEVAQVGCRACAVGGGTYMLGDGLEKIEPYEDAGLTSLRLQKGEEVRTQWLACGSENTPPSSSPHPHGTDASGKHESAVFRSVIIVGSSLNSLFAPVAEQGPVPAVAVVAVPVSALDPPATDELSDFVYIMVHSSDTGECPSGQCVLYASLGATTSSTSALAELTQKAIDKFLDSQDLSRDKHQLWKLSYVQPASPCDRHSLEPDDKTIIFPPSSTDLAFDDSVLDRVKEAWEMITAGDADRGSFLSFERREQEVAEEEDVN